MDNPWDAIGMMMLVFALFGFAALAGAGVMAWKFTQAWHADNTNRALGYGAAAALLAWVFFETAGPVVFR